MKGFQEFAKLVEARLDRSARTIGVHESGRDTRTGVEFVDELIAEALDLDGWGFLLWHRLMNLRNAVSQAEQTLEQLKRQIEDIKHADERQDDGS